MSKRIIVGESVHDRGWTLYRMLVPCGRACCRKCPHGPYWYAQRRMGKKCVEVYIGKSLQKWQERQGRGVGDRVLALIEVERKLAAEVEAARAALLAAGLKKGEEWRLEQSEGVLEDDGGVGVGS